MFQPKGIQSTKVKGGKALFNLREIDGLDRLGDKSDEYFYIDLHIFEHELRKLIARYELIDTGIFFNLVHRALDKTRTNFASKNCLFYHIHNPSDHARMVWFIFSKKAKNLVMVREPLQSCGSWISKDYFANDLDAVINKITTMIEQVFDPFYGQHETIGVKLEDLKSAAHKTLEALSSWMGISYSHSMLTMTQRWKKMVG